MKAGESYQSPFSWRYGSPEMRRIWSEENRRRLWRRLWVALAEAQTEFGLVTCEQVDDLIAHRDEIDLPRALEVEARIQHDLMAELKVYAAQCPVGGGILHLGATSMDIKDNAEVLQVRQSLDLLLPRLQALLLALAGKVEEFAGMPVMAFTHLQPAEPTTLGYRLASFAQDLLRIRDPAACQAGAERQGLQKARWAAPLPTPCSSGRRDRPGWKRASARHSNCPSTRLPPRPIRAGRTTPCSARWPGWPERLTSSPSTCACCSPK